MSFTSGLKDRAIPTQEKAGGYQGPPRIWWYGGEPGKKGAEDTAGEFWTTEKELKGFVPGAPWVRQENRFGKGGVFYVAPTLKVAMVSRRSRPYGEIKDVSGKVTGREYHPFWINDKTPQPWPKGVTMMSKSVYAEYLMLVEGFFDPEKLGTPSFITQEVVYACKGMQGMRMQKVIIPAIEEFILKPAQQAISESSGQRMKDLPAAFMFWAKLVPETTTDKKGKESLVFTQPAGFNVSVQLPVLDIDEEVDQQWLDENYVGDDLLDTLTEMYHQYDGWRAEVKAPAKEEAYDDEDAPRQTSFDHAGARANLQAKNQFDDTDTSPDDIPF